MRGCSVSECEHWILGSPIRITLLTLNQVVLQCLYSQCLTSQFGPALHHTLSACSDSTPDTPDVEPPLIRYQSLRKRGAPTTGAASGHVSASAVHSVARRSASASAYQTFSARVNHRVGRRAAAAHTAPSPTSTTLSRPPSSEDIVSSAKFPAASAP